MYVKFHKTFRNVRKIPKISPKCTKTCEIFTISTQRKLRKIPVRKIPWEFNSSYILKASCEPPGTGDGLDGGHNYLIRAIFCQMTIYTSLSLSFA